MNDDATVRPLHGTHRALQPVVGRAWRVLLAAALACGLAACGDDDEAVQSSAPTAAATLGAAGGTLTGPDGVELVVPPGALSADTELRITKTGAGAPALQADGSVVTPTYEFTPHGLLLEQPVTIRMPFQPPAGAAAADVLMASPGGEWAAVGATVADGKAEWQRISLSYGVGMACAVPVPNPDPYACVWQTLGVAVGATPAGALQMLGARNWRVSAAAVVGFEVRMSAAPDCAAPRLVVRKLVPGSNTQVIADIRLTLSPDPADPHRARATYRHDLALAHEDSGTVRLAHVFECARPGQSSVSISQQTLLTVHIPAPGADVPPAVDTAPQDVTVNAPDSATFTAAGSGSPAPTQQWQRSTDGGNTWTDIAGATGPSYTTGATRAADHGARFRAVFSNRAGSLASAAATLTVLTRATPLAQPLPQADSLPATNAVVAAASAGRFVAAWIVADPVTRAPTGIRTSRYTRAGGWSAAVDVPTVDIDASRGLTAALGNDGTAVVTWVQPAAGQPSAWFVRQAPGGVWSSPALIENDDSVAVRGVKVVADANGTATAVWNTSAARTFASRLDAGSTAWSGPVELGLPNGGSLMPVLAVAADGRVLAAFEDFDRNNGQRVMVANRYVPGSGWSGPAVLMAQSFNDIMSLGNAAIAGNHAAVVYQAVPVAGAGGRNMVSRWSATNGWSAAEELPVGPVGNVVPGVDRQVAVAADGRTSVVWSQQGFVGGSLVRDVYFAEALPGAAFGVFERISPEGGYAAYAQIAADALGNLLVVWSKDVTDLRGQRRPVGGTWGANVSWETATGNVNTGGPLALGPDGDAAMAWIESADGSDDVPTVSVWSP